MFIHINEKLININEISWINFEHLVSRGFIEIHQNDSTLHTVWGPEAFNVIMELCPSALEGKKAKYHRHAWAIHNLIGHPLMQILSWLHLTKLGIKIHDATVPNPIIK